MTSERPQGASPYDDDLDAVPDSTELLRRVHPAFVAWEASGPRVTSQAFQDYPASAAERLGFPAPAMSVAVAEILAAYGNGPEKLLEAGDPNCGVVALSMGVLRGLGEGAMLWPMKDEPWHAITFVRTGQKRARQVRSAIADSARWVVSPRR